MSSLDIRSQKRLNAALWTVQILLALLFLFTGSLKIILPIADLTKQIVLPGLFLRFLGLAEIAGALGLVLPGLFHRRPSLTPLAAGCLVIIMSGAVALTLQTSVPQAFGPGLVGVLASLVAYGRTRLVPLRSMQASRPTVASSSDRGTLAVARAV
jgi:hypothetical protein